MADYAAPTPRFDRLFLLAWLYGTGVYMAFIYLAGLVLVYVASAQLSPRNSRLARFQRAVNWLFDKQLEPTQQTKRVAVWLGFIWAASFIVLYAACKPHGYPDSEWGGWMFLYHSIGLGNMFLATGLVVVYWLWRLPKGQTYLQACSDCFGPVGK